jgi:hypothetical protein
MPISYENRKGELHYIKAAQTKKGGTRYYIVKNLNNPDELINEMPPDFEFYEFPADGLVSFRKIKSSNITDEDFSVLDSVMKNHETVKDYIIDKEENALMLFISGHLRNDFLELDDKWFRQIQRYDDKLRFEKRNNREFLAQRFCFISRYYGWITMETSEDLKYLAEKYCPHVDQESLLQFWKEGEEEPEADVFEFNGNLVYSFLNLED